MFNLHKPAALLGSECDNFSFDFPTLDLEIPEPSAENNAALGVATHMFSLENARLDNTPTCVSTAHHISESTRDVTPDFDAAHLFPDLMTAPMSNPRDFVPLECLIDELICEKFSSHPSIIPSPELRFGEMNSSELVPTSIDCKIPPSHAEITSSAPPSSAASHSSRNHRTELERLVKQVFAIVEDNPEDRWARDFLFDTSRHGTYQMLTNAAAIPYAVSADIRTTMFEKDGAHDGYFDFMSRVGSLLVPTFASGNLIAGVVIERSHRRAKRDGNRTRPSMNSMLYAGPARLHDCQTGVAAYGVGRYVCDTKNARVLFVNHMSFDERNEISEVSVLFVRLKSPARREQVGMCCEGEAFKRGNIIDSIKIHRSSIESRFCTECGAPPNATCGCVVKLYKPRHAFDFESSCRNMKYFTGDYLGMANSVLAVRNAEVGLSRSDAGGERTYFAAPVVLSLKIDGFGEGISEHEKLKNYLMSLVLQLYVPDIEKVPHCLTEFAMEEPTALPDQVVSMKLSNGRRAAVAECRKRSRKLIQHVVEAEQGLSHGKKRDLDSDVMVADGGTSVKCRPNESSADDERNAVPKTGASSQSGIIISKGVVDGTGSDVGSMQATQVAAGGRAILEQYGSNICDDRAARVLLRKERNRESAARSNARRKEKNDSLKRNLAEVRAQAVELRRVEARLRQENLDIRRLLNSLHSHGNGDKCKSSG